MSNTPFPQDQAPSPAQNGWPLRVMMGVVVVSIASVAVGGWQVKRSVAGVEAAASRQHRIETTHGSALYHHEAMTTAAQMFTLNGLPVWQKRYDSAQQQLGQDMIGLRLMTPETMAPLNAVVEEAGGRLRKLEAESFRRMRDGDRVGGLALLADQAYRAAKDHFAESLTTLGQNLGDLSQGEEQHLRDGLAWRTQALGAVLAVLALMWLVCLRLMLGWQARVRAAAEQQHRVEATLSEQGRMLDSIIDNLPVGLFVKSVPDNYKWVVWNRKAEDLFGMSAAQVLGTTDTDHFPEHEVRFFRQIDEQVMRERRVIDIDMEEVTSSRGTWLAHTIKVPIYDAAGKPSRLLGIIEDITVKKQQADKQLQQHARELETTNGQLELARRQAEDAVRAKEAYLVALDGELRSPLQEIVGTADLLLKGRLDADQAGLVRNLRKQAGMGLHILNGVEEAESEARDRAAAEGDA